MKNVIIGFMLLLLFTAGLKKMDNDKKGLEVWRETNSKLDRIINLLEK